MLRMLPGGTSRLNLGELDMQEYLNKGIKDVITQFPAVEDILNDYDIGCAPCNVGDCLLADIVEIHNLVPEDEQLLMARIAKAIYPDREIEIPRITRKRQATSTEIKYSPPVKRLVEEHLLIKRLLALIPRITENLELESPGSRELVLGVVDFIRNFADKYHHAKEEDILFKYFDDNLDIIKAMHQDHDTGRGHVRAIVEATGTRDAETVGEHLAAYRELLTEHIKKEDEILYPWMDRILSTTQIGKLYSQFNEADEKLPDSAEKYGDFIRTLEEKYPIKIDG